MGWRYGLLGFYADKIRDLVLTTGLKSVGVSEKGLNVEFDRKALVEMYKNKGLGSPSEEEVKEVATLVQKFSFFVTNRRILWVDNHPENNRLERAALVNWKVDVQTRRTTEEAMIELREGKDTPFDLVISDWFRNRQPEGQRLAEIIAR